MNVVHAHLPNSNLALRLVKVWFDETTGHLESSDQAIVGWAISENPRCPLPLGVGGFENPGSEPVEAWYVYDQTKQTWTGSNGRIFKEWRDLVGPLYNARDKDQPPPKQGTVWPLDAKRPEPKPLPHQRPSSGPRGTGNTPKRPPEDELP